MDYPKSDKTTISRYARKGSYDQQTIHEVIDEALYCLVSFCNDDQPFAIPTGHVRIENRIYIHGSVKSNFLEQLTPDAAICLSFSIMDGLVLAKSALNHSFNYRSVTVFSNPHTVGEKEEKLAILEAFTEKLIPGRWKDIRKPSPGELKATQIVGFDIREASAKISAGLPNDRPSNRELPIWSGIVLLQKGFQSPEEDLRYTDSIALPPYLQKLNPNRKTT